MLNTDTSKGLFITGTSTGTGKTIVSAALCRMLTDSGNSVVYYKPVQTGAIEVEDNKLISADCRFVRSINESNSKFSTHVTYNFKKPASPHYASRLVNAEIKTEIIEKDYKQLSRSNDFIIVEGAGGVYVPLDEIGFLIIDLARILSLHTILVADAGLGTINHTCLSWYFMKSKKIHISAILMVSYEKEPSDLELENVRIIKKITGIDSVLIIPALTGVDTDANMKGDFFNKLKYFPDADTIIKWIKE